MSSQGVAVKAGNLHLAVGLECLWNSSVCINDLALKDIQVNIDSKKMPPSEQVEEEEDSSPLDLSTPYPITPDTGGAGQRQHQD